MAEQTGIEWCRHSWSPWEGCDKVSPGCRECYAEEMNRRFRRGENWGATAPRRMMSEEYWKLPLRWNRAAEKEGRRRTVFPSICDPFDAHPDLVDVRIRFWQLIRDTPWLDWLLLTKRPENLPRMVPWVGLHVPDPLCRDCADGDGVTCMNDPHKLCEPTAPWKNVWLGTTVENQEYLEFRLPNLLAIPAVVHFLSYEPALGPIDLHHVLASTVIEDGRPLHYSALQQHHDDNYYQSDVTVRWVIAGCESGRHARPYEADWFRKVRDDCHSAGVPFFMKQATDTTTIGRAGVDRPITLGPSSKVKGKAGRSSVIGSPLLDGVAWQQFPVGGYGDDVDDIYERA